MERRMNFELEDKTWCTLGETLPATRFLVSDVLGAGVSSGEQHVHSIRYCYSGPEPYAILLYQFRRYFRLPERPIKGGKVTGSITYWMSCLWTIPFTQNILCRWWRIQITSTFDWDLISLLPLISQRTKTTQIKADNDVWILVLSSLK